MSGGGGGGADAAASPGACLALLPPLLPNPSLALLPDTRPPPDPPPNRRCCRCSVDGAYSLRVHPPEVGAKDKPLPPLFFYLQTLAAALPGVIVKVGACVRRGLMGGCRGLDCVCC